MNRPLVEALRHVADTAGAWSVIGGFAVWCHLGGSHRPTLDIDTAADSPAHETLVALGVRATADTVESSRASSSRSSRSSTPEPARLTSTTRTGCSSQRTGRQRS
ncbi:MAG: hypothetical protein U5R31_05615 [Acidimicrobiia bacterium]|nr:hypothetical protein [Acidimicrobiia bacterium]